MSYTLTNTEFSNLKRRLTKAINSGDTDKIVAECDHAEAIFEAKGWPDDWARWERARSDAQFKARFA